MFIYRKGSKLDRFCSQSTIVLALKAKVSLTRDSLLGKGRPAGQFVDMSINRKQAIQTLGTIMTGTVLSGTLKLNDNVEISSLKEIKKVKSMQVFRTPVDKIYQGDRAGVCVTQFDSKLFERGLVCQPNLLQSTYAAIVTVKKIAYFKNKIDTKTKFHVSIGHETVMGQCSFFGCVKVPCTCVDDAFAFDQEYGYLEGLNGRKLNRMNF